MGATGMRLRCAPMATTGTIPMRVRRTGTMDRRGSRAGCSSAPAPGIAGTDTDTAAITAIEADIMDGPFMGTDARVTVMVMDTLYPTAERTRLETASLAAATTAT